MLLIGVSAAAFFLMAASPIDPLQTNVGQVALGSMSREQIMRLEAYWGVGEPPVKRFMEWASAFVQGDMGVSLLYRRDVSAVLAERLSNSLWLMGAAWALSGLLGFLLGCLAGIRRGGLADRIVRGYSLILSSTPAFWLALLLLTIFSVWLKVLPIGFSIPVGMASEGVTLMDRLRHAVLPALTLSLAGIPQIALHTREKMADVMESDYVLFAKARGERTLSIALRHGARNVLLPAVTLQFASFSEIFGGSVLVEQVFSYPGLGQAAVTAGLGSDMPLLMGIVIVSAVFVFCGNFAADILYGVIDPRIRRGGANR